MRSKWWLLSVGIIFLVSCTQASNPSTMSRTDTILKPTHTSIPTNTSLQTSTPTNTIAPTATITPPVIEPVAISALALNETNAGTKMKLLTVFGTGEPNDMSWSPDGNLFAVATARGVWLYDGNTLHENGFIEVDGNVSQLAFSEDGQILFLALSSKIELWNVASRQVIKSLDTGGLGIYGLAYGKGGHIAVLGLRPGYNYFTLAMWEVATGRLIFSVEGIGNPPLVFSPDGKLIAYQSDQGLILADARTGKSIAENKLYPQSFGFSSDGTKVFIINDPEKGKNEIWDSNLNNSIPLGDCPLPMAWSENDLICGGSDGIYFIDLTSGMQIRRLEIKPTIYGNCLRPDGKLLAMLDHNNNVHILNAVDGTEIKTIQFTSFYGLGENIDIAVGLLRFDGGEMEVVATVDRAGDIRLWDIENEGVIIRTLETGSKVVGVAFSPDKRTLASLSVDGTLKLWDVQNGTVDRAYDASSPLLPDAKLSGPIAYSPTGNRLALFADGNKYLLDFQSLTHEPVGSSMLADPEGTQFFFLPAGGLLDYNLNQGTFTLVNTTTNETMIPSLDLHENAGFGGYSSEVEASTIRPDGGLFAFATQEGLLNVWNLTARKLLKSFKSHPKITTMANVRSVSSLDFSPRSYLLVTTGADATTRLWNIKTGTELRRLNVCCYAGFTPDAQYLITAGRGVIRVWGITQ